MAKLPAAKEHLEYTELEKDLLVYCAEQNQGYALNPTACKVLKLCRDGKTEEEALEALGNGPEADELLQCTLYSLVKKGLLVESDIERGPSRRDFLKKWGVAAAIFPIVGAAFIPPAANAQSGTTTDVGIIILTTPDPGASTGPIG